MEVFRDPECTQRLSLKGTVMDTTISQIREHLTDNRTLHYKHGDRCHAATFTAGNAFTLGHDDSRTEHKCSDDKSTLGECIKGGDLPAFRSTMAAHAAKQQASAPPPTDPPPSLDLSTTRFLR